MKRWMLLFLVSAAALLAGCAGPRIVDSDVTTYSTLTSLPAAATATFRFERLPSQQLGGEPQGQLEGLATAALNKVGLRRDDVTPRYSVLIGLRIQRFERGPWDDPFWPGWGFGPGFGGPDYVVNRRGQVIFLPTYPRMPGMPWYEREVSLLMRDLSTNQVVYETRAQHDGRWHDTVAVLPAMFDAALQGFPTPPQGTRRVNIEIAR
jgi:hypothetical protein